MLGSDLIRNKLDTLKSNFYTLKTDWNNDSIIKGKLSFFSIRDNKGNPLRERSLRLDLVQFHKDSIGLTSFESKNQNFVEFEFKNRNDTIIGLLTELRLTDTIVDGDEKVNFVTTKTPIDNKDNTDNLFIHFHELNKNKR
ncbi:MAG: hypothetical protein N2A99_06570 [Carnobacterium alterfunditum]